MRAQIIQVIPTAWQIHSRAVLGMLFLLNRSRELTHLMAWVERKKRTQQGAKFFRIQRCYKEQQNQADHKLSLLRYRFPVHYYLAKILHALSNMLAVKPSYYRYQVRTQKR